MSDHGLCCVECYANGVAQGEDTGAAVELDRLIGLLDEALIYDEPVVIERDRLIALLIWENE
jgi:hypothetical protein